MPILFTLGKYQIEREVGRGGFAVVYQAVDPTLGRRVAIKVPHAWLLTDPKFVERFRREARLAANLTHPHIVTIHEIGEEQGVPFIAMEWLEGMPLDQWLETVKPPPQVVLQALLGVGAALDVAHARSVVHRDIKPSNIMMTANRGGVLTDFGIARLLAQASQSTSGVMGTPNYMAPEVLKGQPATAAADIYALGVTLYEALAGRLPFIGEAPQAVAFQHATASPPDPRSFNPALPPSVALLLQALAKEPGQRPASAEKLIRGLLAGFGGGRVPVVGLRPYSQRRQPLTFLVAGALLLVAILLLALTLANRLSPPEIPTPDTTISGSGTTKMPTTPTRTSTPRPADIVTPTPLPTKSPTLTPTITGVIGVTFIVDNDNTNARQGPATNYPIVGKLQAGEQFQILARNDAVDLWWQFDYRGNHAWVLASLVSANVTPDEVIVARDIPPTPSPQYHKFSLQTAGNNMSTSGYVLPPLGNVILLGVPFDLGQGQVFTSQAVGLPNNARSVIIPTNVSRPQAVYLLLTGGNLYSRYNGQVVGRVILHYSGNPAQAIDLVAGYNLREWKQGDSVVHVTTSPDVQQAWAGPSKYDSSSGVIDRLQVPVPPEFQSYDLVKVEVIDDSVDRFGELDPAVNLLGITVYGY